MITHPLLTQLAGGGIRLGLDRTKSFLQALGEPQRAYPVVHIAGTNGKGSTCAMVTEALRAAGLRVGLNTSPHLEHVNERIRIDGVPVHDEELVAALETVDRMRWDWAKSQQIQGLPLTYFEFITAAAFVAFARAQVDIAVVEVGLGGRLDATNVVDPVVTAVTHIGLDHTDKLGDTVEQIAWEKAGIFKREVPVVLGAMPKAARGVCMQRAEHLVSPCWATGKSLFREHLGGRRWDLGTPRGTLKGVQLAMEGDHQGANALVALGILHQLQAAGLPISDEAIVYGLEHGRMSGRVEVLRPGLVVDGAHNADGARALARWLAKQDRPQNRILLWGMGEGRDSASIIEPLLPYVDEVVTTRCAHPKARDPYELALELQRHDILLAAGAEIEETLPEVVDEADEVVVAGSLYLVGAVRALVSGGVLD